MADFFGGARNRMTAQDLQGETIAARLLTNGVFQVVFDKGRSATP